MIDAVQIGLAFVLGFPLLYLAILTVLASIEKRRRVPIAQPSARFAIVVPAHNEEITIAGTVMSMRQTDYPPDHMDVVVIADNCSDRTAEIARSNGARVLERINAAERGKGHALRWGFTQLLSEREPYDALVVVDADSVVSGNFLIVLNSYLADGARIIQCNDMVRPSATSWSAEMTRIGFILYNYVRPLGRRALGFSAGLRGNGMCFSSDVLRSYTWEAYSRAEDLEFGLHLLLKGEKVVLAPEALVLATMPENPANAESQRMRWEGGRLPVVRRYAPLLLKRAFRSGSINALDALMDLITPPLINHLAVVTLFLAINILLAVFGLVYPYYALLWACILMLGVFHLFVGLAVYGADARTYAALLRIPRYAIWKGMLLLRRKSDVRSREWVRTTRERPSTDTHNAGS